MKIQIMDRVKEFVEEEIKKPDAHYKEAFDTHIKVVVQYCLELAEKRNADKEIVGIAAWLHDIGSIRGDYANHHLIGGEIADKLLNNLGYPRDKIERVKHCIMSHRGSVVMKRKSVEAQILVDADAMSHFDDIDDVISRFFDGDKINMLAKLERSYAKLSDDAKPLVFGKLEKARKELK